MLRSLFIQNFALIEHLVIDFRKRFTVITGETGAGKSLIIGALSQLLGQKANRSLLIDIQKKCIIEGVFVAKNATLKKLFKQNNLDYEEETIIRREIHHTGKSRIFVNDTPTSVSCVKEIGRLLIDIHSQHQNLLLFNKSFQLNIIDNVAKNTSLKSKYTRQYGHYKKKLKELENLKTQYIDLAQNIDYYNHQVAEVNAANLIPSEQESLETRQKQLSNAEEIKSTVHQSLESLSKNEDSNVVATLHEVCNLLTSISPYFPSIKTLIERVESMRIEADDISRELENISEDTSYNEEALQQISERLNLLYSLQSKHKVGSVSDVLQLQESWVKKINQYQSYDVKITSLNSEISVTKGKLTALAQKLSSSRKTYFPVIEKRIIRLLKNLGIPNARFHIDHSIGELTPEGQDGIQFMFTANKNTSLQPIENVASGGEISRLMMCLKHIDANASNQFTIIFDEIDAGLSGKIAQKMGEIMQQISHQQQIICITHLPQIAGLGEEHFSVQKSETGDSTVIQLKNLEHAERIREIAKMLSGTKVTESALKNAKELLMN